MGSFKLKFPCGLEIKANSIWCYLDDETIEQIEKDGCPLHGKKCSRSKR